MVLFSSRTPTACTWETLLWSRSSKNSRRYVERAVEAGVDAKLDVWMGMPHGFVNDVGRFNAATQALSAIGAFLIERLREGA